MKGKVIEHRNPGKPTRRYWVGYSPSAILPRWEQWASYNSLNRAKRVARRLEWFWPAARVIDTEEA